MVACLSCSEIKSCNITLAYTPTYTTIEVRFSSVTQLCPTLCNPMNHSMPGFPVHHQLLESTQTHVH